MKQSFIKILSLFGIVFYLTGCGGGGGTSNNTPTNITIDPQAYYIDAQNGNDNNDGKSPKNAWKSIAKLNNINIAAGNKLLFRAGQRWTGMLHIHNQGTSQNPIVISSYGDGNPPEISVVKVVTPEWKRYNESGISKSVLDPVNDPSNVWVANILQDNPDRVKQGGRELLGAYTSTELGPRFPWFYNAIGKNLIYFYASSKPGNIETNTEVAPLYLENAKYVTIRNITLIGGYVAGIFLEECSNITIDQVNVGYMAKQGVYVKNEHSIGRNIIIKDTLVDSGYTLDYSFAGVGENKDGNGNTVTTTSRSASEGIIFLGAIQNSTIVQNTIKNWTHANINFSTDNDEELSNNEIYNNLIVAPDIAYGGRIGIDGKNTHHNNFHNNQISNTAAPIQFNGHDNTFQNNLVENTRNSPLKNEPTGYGLTMQGYDSAVYNNLIQSNTFKNTAEAGIKISGNNPAGSVTNNTISKNLFINAGAQVLIEAASAGQNQPNTIEGNVFQ